MGKMKEMKTEKQYTNGLLTTGPDLSKRGTPEIDPCWKSTQRCFLKNYFVSHLMWLKGFYVIMKSAFNSPVY